MTLFSVYLFILYEEPKIQKFTSLPSESKQACLYIHSTSGIKCYTVFLSAKDIVINLFIKFSMCHSIYD